MVVIHYNFTTSNFQVMNQIMGKTVEIINEYDFQTANFLLIPGTKSFK
jgi:hypothetical protein